MIDLTAPIRRDANKLAQTTYCREHPEKEVIELLATRQERQRLDYVTAREVHRARIVNTADAGRALLARMEREGLLTGEDGRPAHGGKTTRIFRAVGGTNPVPG